MFSATSDEFVFCVFLFSPDDACRLSDYHRLKTKILDLQDQRFTGSAFRGAHHDTMAAKKQLVDVMFKSFDIDNDGRIDASELSQVSRLSRLRLNDTLG